MMGPGGIVGQADADVDDPLVVQLGVEGAEATRAGQDVDGPVRSVGERTVGDVEGGRLFVAVDRRQLDQAVVGEAIDDCQRSAAAYSIVGKHPNGRSARGRKRPRKTAALGGYS